MRTMRPPNVETTSTDQESVNGSQVIKQRKKSEKSKKSKDYLYGDLISDRVDDFVKNSVNNLVQNKQLSEDKKALLKATISELDDVDFVLIAHKPTGKPFLQRLAFRLISSNHPESQPGDQNAGRQPPSPAEIYQFRADSLRFAYLNKLKADYGVEWKSFETEDRVYYAINLSFAHLGLMTQLLSYEWRLANRASPAAATTSASSALPHLGETIALAMSAANRGPQSTQNLPPAYKSFHFIKTAQAALEGSVDFRYKLFENCENRTSYTSQLRHDLAYNFLFGARVKLLLPADGLSPWRAVLSCGRGDREMPPPISTTDVNLHDIIDYGIFDDWLCLHEPFPNPETEENETKRPTKEDIESAGKCCTLCCFPCITCQCCCPPGKGPCKTMNKYWRNFWYSNTIDCVDLNQRGNLGQPKNRENDRQFLSRVSTIRNALTPNSFFRSDDNGDGVPDTDKDIKESDNDNSSLYRMYHLIPLETLRRYFGEKVAFYFSWVELLIMTLVVPGVLGIAMFIAGIIYYAVQVHNALSEEDKANANSTSAGSINDETSNRETPGYVLAKACDNYATIGFAAVMIIWGTAFGELWKRRSCWYKFLWRVGHLEDNELRRDNVYSLRCIEMMHRHKFTHLMMYLPSLIITFFFILLVWASIYLINMLDIRLSMQHCSFPPPPVGRFVTTTTTTISPSNSTETGFFEGLVNKATSYFVCNILCVVLHSVSIAILDAIFTIIVYPLTHIEGHNTQSAFNASLILKMFTFRFVNNYSILFYIAFVVAPDYGTVTYPEALTGINEADQFRMSQARYRSCKQLPCMTLLSKQLLGIILTAPLIRTFKDRLLPMLILLIKRLFAWIKNKRLENVGTVSPSDVKFQSQENLSVAEQLNRRRLIGEFTRQYEDLDELSSLNYREFTIEEFTEKAIVYGALLMFSVALPPAPALAMLIMRIDLNFDVARMVESFRRPVPLRSSGIGVWADIIQFLTFCGIVTNPLIVVLTSSWNAELSIWWKFWVFLIFEHVVFAIRAIVAACVPDEPRQLRNLRLLQKKAKHDIPENEANNK